MCFFSKQALSFLTLCVLPLLVTAQVELPGPEACAEERWRQDFEDPLHNEMLRNSIWLPNDNFMLTGSQAEMPEPAGSTEEFWFREITTDGELVRELFPLASLPNLVPYFSDFERMPEGDFVGVSHVFCPTSSDLV